MSTEAGQLVTLQFADGRVEVQEVSAERQRALKLCAGGLLLGIGVGAVAANAGGRGITGLDLGLSILSALLLAGFLAGAAWWFVLAARDKRRPAEAITAPDVVSAQSKAGQGQVTVTLNLADGRDRSFSATGHSGATLSARFSEFMSRTAD